MSVFDQLKGKASGLKDKAEHLVGGNAGRLKGAVGHVGGFIDQKTGGKYAGRVGSLQAKAAELIDKADRKHRNGPAAPSGGNPAV
ncbi:antitoxin [Arthrobacter mobilis]|uniref:Antitoxin n=1 Tax=Arthrobacter mobilis TaxID=2724944 RepID=A0A7X6HF79_9MICC|nr:antitoxin [Arthrobacter mobilis]NKX56053.1 antitoxin [Arthrobacter mobilis]